MASSPSPLASRLSWLRSLLTNRFFWGGLAVFLLIGAGLYLLVDNLIMPVYTRQTETLTVPDVVQMPYEQASRLLQARNLEVERVVQRFNADLPRDAVVDQNPRANALVKPGRTVYLTVNSGQQKMVRVPSLKDLSVREAENRLVALGLRVAETLPDSIPHPHQNTVTRQEPAAGDSLAEGSSVRLWYSTGLGRDFASVPDVTGLSVDEAQQVLIEHRLRSVVIGAPERAGGEATEEPLIVHRQSREPGTRVPQGFEIRLYVGETEPAAPPEGPPVPPVELPAEDLE